MHKMSSAIAIDKKLDSEPSCLLMSTEAEKSIRSSDAYCPSRLLAFKRRLLHSEEMSIEVFENGTSRPHTPLRNNIRT